MSGEFLRVGKSSAARASHSQSFHGEYSGRVVFGESFPLGGHTKPFLLDTGNPPVAENLVFEKSSLGLVIGEFTRLGILLESDQKLPNIVTLVVGERVRGSWWGHPEGRKIWRVLNQFDTRHDVLTTKLVSGKVTFVHRRLWADFLAISTSKEEWQTDSLSVQARSLFKLVEDRGEVKTGETRSKSNGGRQIADAARELERRLLIHSEEIHTPRGFHTKILRSWKRWARTVRFAKREPSVPAAKARFEKLLKALNDYYGADGRLPWAD